MPDLAPSPDMWRSYAEPAPVAPPWATPKNLNEAQAAVSAAMQFQGMRGFQQDVQSGMDPQSAMLKHGPKMFFKQPAQFAAALHKVTPIKQMPEGPLQMRPLVGQEGKFLGQYAYVTPDGRVHMTARQADPEAIVAAKERDFSASILKSQIENAYKELAGMGPRDPERAALEGRIKQWRKEASDLFKRPSGRSAQPAYFRDKKTGKKVTYGGNLADLPADQYEPWTQP